MLWGFIQKNLLKTLFPLGKYRKTEIKQMAVDFGYEELSKKSESYEICFIPDNDYRGFLKRKIEGLEEKLADGNFVSTTGKVIGKHKGYPFYTIGQRKGLDIAFGKPIYVIEIIPETNTVVLGEEEDLKKQEMWVKDFNLIKFESLKNKLEVLTKIRYKDVGTFSSIEEVDGDIKVLFNKKVYAIAPGQSAVFYDGNDIIGGGIIKK